MFTFIKKILAKPVLKLELQLRDRIKSEARIAVSDFEDSLVSDLEDRLESMEKQLKESKKIEKFMKELIKSDEFQQFLGDSMDERIIDHTGICLMIEEKIKPIEAKVEVIEKGVLEVKQSQNSNYNLQPTPAEIHIGEQVKREDREVNITYQKKVREATKEVNETNAKLEKIRKLEVANGGSFSAIQVRSSLRISAEDIQDFVFDLVDKSFIYEVEKKNGIPYYKTVR
jgi:uncharacterized protein YfkK (UPF0435 family)